jgi:hypothetical protein
MILKKSVLIKCAILLLLFGVGILTKNKIFADSGFIRNHLGGIVYVVFWIIFFSILFFKAAPFKISLWVFVVTSGIEYTQLIHTPALDLYRTKFVFQALFGSTFNGFDLFWYFVGAVCGFLILQVFNTLRFTQN